MLEEDVPAAVLGWMAVTSPLLLGVIAILAVITLYQWFAKPSWCRFGTGAIRCSCSVDVAVAVGCFDLVAVCGVWVESHRGGQQSLDL